MKDKINIGIIGCGHWGPNFIRNFSQLPGSRVWGVCDLDRKKLNHIRRLYPRVKTFADYKKILDSVYVDAVVISTPAITHYALTKEALNKGKHVLVEKPMSLNIKEAQELIVLSRDKKRILMVGHTFLYNSGINKLKELIKNKTLGRVYYLHSKRTNLGPLRKDVSAMWDLAPHDIAIFCYLLDEMPLEIIARGQDYLQKGKEDITFITLTYPDKIIVNIHVSWLDPRKVREITVVGSKKMAVFDDLNTNEPVRLYDKRVIMKKYKHDYDSFKEFQMLIREGEVIIPKISLEEPLKSECRNFLECVQKNAVPLSDGVNGLRVLRILTAIQESLDKKGKPVKLT